MSIRIALIIGSDIDAVPLWPYNIIKTLSLNRFVKMDLFCSRSFFNFLSVDARDNVILKEVESSDNVEELIGTEHYDLIITDDLNRVASNPELIVGYSSFIGANKLSIRSSETVMDACHTPYFSLMIIGADDKASDFESRYNYLEEDNIQFSLLRASNPTSLYRSFNHRWGSVSDLTELIHIIENSDLLVFDLGDRTPSQVHDNVSTILSLAKSLDVPSINVEYGKTPHSALGVVESVDSSILGTWIRKYFFNLSFRKQFFKRCIEAQDILPDAFSMVEEKLRANGLKIKITFSGHDLKFVDKIIEQFQNDPLFEVFIDAWYNHNKNDEGTAIDVLNRSDVIFCEWGLGNLEFYSSHKSKNQLLISRIHRQELVTDHINRIRFSNVDRLIFIAPHVQEQYIQKSRLTDIDMSYQENYVDIHRVANGIKQPDAVNYIGIVGIVPKLKNPALALDICKILWNKNPHAKLLIKGKRPEEYDWIRKRPLELEYYEAFFKEIKQLDCPENVEFVEYEVPMRDFYSRIGFILSTSDYEGSHQSIAEGIAANCIPIVRNWTGAKYIYQGLELFDSAEAAAEKIFQIQNNYDQYVNKFQKYRLDFVYEHSPESVYKKIKNIIRDHYFSFSCKSNERMD